MNIRESWCFSFYFFTFCEFVGNVPEQKNFTSLSGRGIKAEHESKIISVGNELLMRENGVDVSGHMKAYEDLQDQAKTAVFVAYDGKVMALSLSRTLSKITRLRRSGSSKRWARK